jgi:hypothetical protein
MKNCRLWSLLFCCAFQIHSASAQQDYYNDIRESCIKFISTLSSTQGKSALLAFDDTARIQWNNLPVGMRARAGMSIGQMTEDQRKLLHRILSVSLSSQGYLKATGIFHLDNLLNDMYDSFFNAKTIDSSMYRMVKGLQWGHRNFYLAFFGKPGDKQWGYKIEGHHLSLNFSFIDTTLSVSPFFIGTDPSEYPIREFAGWRVLGQEEDLGIKLINSLSSSQQKKAIISNDVPGDIFTAAESGKRLVDYQGIKAAELNSEQKEMIRYIIREFVFNLEYEKAVIEYNKIIKAGVDEIYFAWIGAKEEDKLHYFMLNGPTFLIEFDNNGFGQNANHIHAIWREKGNEYGEDILKKHYQSVKH